MNIIYGNAFAETLFIIRCLSKDEQNKIPNSFIEFLDNNQNKNYLIKIDPNKDLQNQNLLEETKELLKEIYISYFISEEEKRKINQQETYRNIVEEDLKSQKYNYNIFEKQEIQESPNNNSLIVVQEKNSIFRNLLNKIKNYFLKQKNR